MRRISWIISFSCFFLFAFPQVNFSWFPLHPSVQYNYRIDTSAGPVSTVLKIDSTSSQAQPGYYLNKIVTGCDTCNNAQLVNDPFDSTYVLNHQPQFLGHLFIRTGGNGFYFRGQERFVIYPFGAVGSSWLYDTLQNVSATVVSKNLQSVLGTNDSVVRIKLSTNDTIMLSKHSGIIKFPLTGTSHYYTLVGLEGATTAGIRLKRFHDFFDFAAGDVLQYEFTDDDFNILPPKIQAGRERWDILASTVFNDSVRCLVRKTHLDSVRYGSSASTITAFISTVTITFTDSLKHPANFYPLQEVLVNPYFIFNNGIRHIHKIVQGINSSSLVTKTFGQACPDMYLSHGATGAAMETTFPNVFLNKNSAKIVGRELTEGLGFTSELYNDYDRIYQNCLVGYVKHGDTSGVIYNGIPLAIKTNGSLRASYSIYPVPANGQLFITGNIKPGARISIVSCIGQEELFLQADGEKTQVINTSALSNGIYFIVISDQHFSETTKLIIQH